uniref:Uncharacterized protein n=1 Tax=Ascaris lumbricoides TaxID=6252 RepID=A0A9J2Q028_ASCLU
MRENLEDSSNTYLLILQLYPFKNINWLILIQRGGLLEVERKRGVGEEIGTGDWEMWLSHWKPDAYNNTFVCTIDVLPIDLPETNFFISLIIFVSRMITVYKEAISKDVRITHSYIFFAALPDDYRNYADFVSDTQNTVRSIASLKHTNNCSNKAMLIAPTEVIDIIYESDLCVIDTNKTSNDQAIDAIISYILTPSETTTPTTKTTILTHNDTTLNNTHSLPTAFPITPITLITTSGTDSSTIKTTYPLEMTDTTSNEYTTIASTRFTKNLTATTEELTTAELTTSFFG